MQSKHRHNSAMSRRNTPAMKALVMAGIMAFLVFMIYSYHKSNTELARKTKFVEKLTQEHDSLSAQLQVVYEHKSRLETQLKDEEKKNKDMAKDFQSQLKSAETNYLQEKEALQERISSINQQNKLLEGRKDELEQEYGKLQSDYDKVLQDSRMGMEENLKEFQQAKQQCENDIARLRDDIANLERRNDVLTEQVKGAQNANVEAQQQLQQQQQNIAQAQQQQQNNAQAQQQQQNNIAAQQKNLPAQPNGLAQQNNVAGLQQNNGQDNNGFLQQNNALAQENKVPFQANNAFGQQQQNNVGQENNVPMQQNKVLGEQNNVAADNNVLHFQPGQQNEIKQENEAVAPVDLNMQINKPGDQPAYFKPKLQPEHVEEGADDVVARAVNGDDNADHENPAQQVVPPQIDAVDHEDRNRDDDEEAAQVRGGGRRDPAAAVDGVHIERGGGGQQQGQDGIFPGLDRNLQGPNGNFQPGMKNALVDHKPNSKGEQNDDDTDLKLPGAADDARGFHDNKAADNNAVEDFQGLGPDDGKFHDEGLAGHGNLMGEDGKDNKIFRADGLGMNRPVNMDTEFKPKKNLLAEENKAPERLMAEENEDKAPEGLIFGQQQGVGGVGGGDDHMEVANEKEEDDAEEKEKNKHYYDDADGQYQEDQEDEDEHHNQENDAAR